MLNHAMERFIGRLSPIAFALLRIVSGLLMAAHGGQKILGWFHPKMGLPPVGSLFWVGGVIELVGGFLIAFGLLGSIAAFVLSGQMAVAYFMAHATGGQSNVTDACRFIPVVNGGESAVLYCFIFLYIACHGSGILSLDHLLFRRTATAPVTVP